MAYTTSHIHTHTYTYTPTHTYPVIESGVLHFSIRPKPQSPPLVVELMETQGLFLSTWVLRFFSEFNSSGKLHLVKKCLRVGGVLCAVERKQAELETFKAS